MKKVSWVSRAGWPGGKLSAVKLWKSSSTSGPSATSKPISAKITASSSITWVIGCSEPCGSGRTGRVTSTVSEARAASSALASRSALRASRASLRRVLRPLSAGPITWRSSGLILPSSRIISETEPFLPRADTRTASSAASSAAPSIWLRTSASSVSRLDVSVMVFSVPRGRGGFSGCIMQCRQGVAALVSLARLRRAPLTLDPSPRRGRGGA